MIRFNCDYSEGAHPKVLEKLISTNMEQTKGYGLDPYCIKAASLIKEKIHREDADIHFIVGGTQTNLIVIASALRPHEGAIAADTGHINVHETGAIEACGHKVLAIKSDDGKLRGDQIEKYCCDYYNDDDHEHMVKPKLVYISNPTEIGTIYSKAELENLSRVCKKNNLYLYLDGARLGYGLCAEGNDLNLKTIAELCDVFYIGGTKEGALFGEAVVILNDELKRDFRYMLKQRGALLAKGRLLGLQFIALFEDDLYFNVSEHADKMAMKIKEAFAKKGYKFIIPSNTNQQFPIISNDALEKLKENYEYSFLKKIDDKYSAVRFCTSWATKEEDVDKLIKDIEEI